MAANSPQPIAITTTAKKPRLGLFGSVLAMMVVMGVVVAGVAAASGRLGVHPETLWKTRDEPLPTIEIGRGDLLSMVTETGTVESASNVTVRCQVEALIGLVGGGKAGQNGSGSRTGAAAGGAAGGAAGSGASGSSSSSATAADASKTKTSKSSKTSKAGGSTAGKSSSSKSKTSSSSSSASSSSSSASSSGGGSGSSSTGVTTLTRPQISSFTMQVSAYVPLKSATKSASSSSSKKSSRSGGGSGGGGGGGGGGSGGETEKPGSTRILTIKPEGTQVTAGEVVCELDASAFKDEVLAQKIKYDQAKAFVEQAKALLVVNEIARLEYRDGILPQDRLLIRQYLEACITDEKRMARNVEWSEKVLEKGYRSPTQHEADVLNLTRARIMLDEARGMRERLENFTAPKILKTLDAKLEANRADILAQEAAFQLESDRLHRLEKMVANCTLRAPGDGIVVYAQPASGGWRTTSTQIQEGVTVREGQAIFELPDARHMRVKARVNESKVREINLGQKAAIQLDAFPGRTFIGSVSEITAIPAPPSGFSDVRVYFVNVNLESGNFEGLRSGLTAEVSFFAGRREGVTRIPLASIRWRDGQPYAAVTTNSERTAWQWRPLTIGLMDDTNAEVVSGLAIGDRVVAKPYDLAAAPPIPTAPVPQRAAGESNPAPRG